MKFATLLAAAGIVRNSGTSVAYRPNKHVYLPKFGSPKNPFAKVGTEANLVETPAASPDSEPGTSPAKMTAKHTPAKRAAQPARSTHWTASLIPLAMFGGNKSSSLRTLKAEQTELTLDMVKVVGSDLRDAEVENVPLKSRPARPPAEWSKVGNDVWEANLV